MADVADAIGAAIVGPAEAGPRDNRDPFDRNPFNRGYEPVGIGFARFVWDTINGLFASDGVGVPAPSPPPDPPPHRPPTLSEIEAAELINRQFYNDNLRMPNYLADVQPFRYEYNTEEEFILELETWQYLTNIAAEEGIQFPYMLFVNQEISGYIKYDVTTFQFSHYNGFK
ncbi:MAG: hypothetical protein ACT4O2_12665 [Beijerinckiaceae bacterium]